MRFAVLAATCLAAVGFATTAHADATKFGGAGQLAISDDQPLAGVSSSSGLGLTPSPPGTTSLVSFQFGTASDNGGSGTEFALSPAADYFVIDNLSVGGQIQFGVLSPAHGNSGSGTTLTLFGIGPRVGYDLKLTDTITFWPKLFFGYQTLSGSNNSGSANSTEIGIFAPFLWHPAPHFFLGIGPNVWTQLSNNVTSVSTSSGTGVPTTTTSQTQAEPKVTQLGLQATFGGWFLGD